MLRTPAKREAPPNWRGRRRGPIWLYLLLGALALGLIMGAVALYTQLEDPPHHGGGFFIQEPVVLVLRVFSVVVNGVVGGGLASVVPCLIRRALLAAAISQIPLRHDIDERGKLSRTLVGAVHAVADGDEADALLPKENFRKKSSL